MFSVFWAFCVSYVEKQFYSHDWYQMGEFATFITFLAHIFVYFCSPDLLPETGWALVGPLIFAAIYSTLASDHAFRRDETLARVTFHYKALGFCTLTPGLHDA